MAAKNMDKNARKRLHEQKEIPPKVVRIARNMSAGGLSLGSSGNVSSRFGTGFLITPSGLSYCHMEREDLVYVDRDGKAQHKRLEPSSEWRFHHDIYQHFPQAGGIVHCHSRHATALACDNREIPAFHYMVAAAGGKKIPIAPYALFGTQELSTHVVEALTSEGVRACLMQHHGLVVFGEDVAAAYDLAEEIEELAAQYVLVRGLGGTALLSDAQMDEVIERFKTYGKQVKK